MKKLITVVLVGAFLTGCSMPEHRVSTDGSGQIDTLIYQCGSLPLVVSINQSLNEAKLFIDGQMRTLPLVVSASGAKYNDGSYTFWSSGNHATVYRGETIVFDECQLPK